MHCASCAQDIENSLKRLKGIVEINVNFASSQAIIEYDEAETNRNKIKKIIEGLGYRIEEPETQSKNLFNKYFPVIRVTLVGLFLLLSWLAGFLKWQIHAIPYLHNTGDIFAFLAIVIGWWPILKNAIQTILSKNINVKVLVSIAIIASLFIGAYKEAATVIFIVLLAGFLESFDRKDKSNY